MKLEDKRVEYIEFWAKLVAICVLVILLDYGGKLVWFRKMVENVVRPVVAVGRLGKEGVGSIADRVQFARYGAMKIVDMERRVAELTATASRVGDLEEENRLLREQLGAVSDKEEYGVGDVVSVGTGEMTVDFGGDVPRKDDVVLWKSVLVGVVGDVGGRMVKVKGVESMGEFSVKVVDSSGTKKADGVIKGKRSSSLFLTKILQEAEFDVGDKVLTSGNGGKYPEGLLVGEVIEVVSRDSSVYREALVKPPIRMSDLEVVFWLKNWRGGQ